MGLDMHLAKKTYVKQWEFQTPEEKFSVEVKKGGVVVKSIDPKRVSHVIEEVAYWRKANQIHQWFVDNVQDGNDDCKEYYVTREKLQELVDLCKLVLASSHLVDGKVANGKRLGANGEWEPILEDGKTIVDPTLAQTLLPTAEGFFFGGTDYDEYYYQDLEHTVEMLEAELALEDNSFPDYLYCSSW